MANIKSIINHPMNLSVIAVLVLWVTTQILVMEQKTIFGEITLLTGFVFLFTGYLQHRISTQKKDLTHIIYLGLTGLRAFVIVPAVLWVLKTNRYPTENLKEAAFWLMFNLILMLALEVKGILRILRPD